MTDPTEAERRYEKQKLMDPQALNITDLADAAIAALREKLDDSVPRGWDGLLTILKDIYPASVFGGVDDDWQDETRDLGPRLVTLGYHLDAERHRAEQAEAINDQWEVQAARIMEERNKAEAEVERLRWIAGHEIERLRWIAGHEILQEYKRDLVVEREPKELADLESRWAAREEAGDD